MSPGITKRRERVTPLGQVLHSLLRSWGVDGKVRERQAVALWGKTVGPRIAENTEAVGIEDGKIFIRVRSSTWKTELVFVKPEIIDRLNIAVGKKVIRDIIFVSDSWGSRISP
jgi:predicted nucleic acid-binding Zn ribbon protein